MQGDPSEGQGAHVPRPDGPPGMPDPAQPNPPYYNPPYYPPYSTPYPGYAVPPTYAAPPGPMPRRGVPWYAWVIGGCLVLLLLVGGSCIVLGATMGNLFKTLANEQTVTENSSQSFTVSASPQCRSSSTKSTGHSAHSARRKSSAASVS